MMVLCDWLAAAVRSGAGAQAGGEGEHSAAPVLPGRGVERPGEPAGDPALPPHRGESPCPPLPRCAEPPLSGINPLSSRTLRSPILRLH